MADLGTAYVNIVPKAQGIEKEIGSMFGGGGAAAASQKAGYGFGKQIVKGLKVGLVGTAAAVGVIAKSALEAGGKLEQSFGGLETIYGDAGKMSQYYAKQAAAYGLSANDYAEQAVSFGASLKAAYEGDTWKAMTAADIAIKDMADNAAKMGTPIENIQSAYQGFAKQNYTLLDNLNLGYGGTKQEMERLLKDAEAFSGVKYDINNLGDVYDAIHVIQGELGLTGVAASEAKTTLQGSAASVKASWENMMAALTTGEGLDTAMSNMSESVNNFATNVLQMLSNLAPQLPGMILGLADVIIDNAPEFLAAGVELIVKLGAGLIEAIPKVVGKIPEIISRIKSAFSGTDWGSIGRSIIDGLVNGLIGAAQAVYTAIGNLCSDALGWAKSILGIGSPSRVFAQEVGHWIPPGIAVGIDDNLAPLNEAMQAVVDTTMLDMQRAVSMPTQSASQGASLERSMAALANRPVQVGVVLDANARKMLRVVRQENFTETKRTNYNGLAVMA